MAKIKRKLRNVAHRQRPTVRNRGFILRRIAKKLDFIYFGRVDQFKDDHDLVRGITVSPVHNDDHYMMGKFDDRDVTIVDRSDVLGYGKQEIRHYWLIIRVELDYVLPHILLLPNNHENKSYRQLIVHQAFVPIDSLLNTQYHQDFTSRYSMLSLAGYAPMVEDIISIDTARVIAARFWPSAIEVNGKYVYVYMDEKALNETKTAATIEATVWLSNRLSERSN